MLDLQQTYLIDRVAERFRALGEPNRLRLLVLLREGERNVSELTDALGLRQASVSKHLAVLRQAGLVTVRRDGAQALYRVADESIYDMCQSVCAGVMEGARGHAAALGLAETQAETQSNTRPRTRTGKNKVRTNR